MSGARTPGGWLGLVESLGNRLPDPVTLFAAGTLAVMLVSAVGFRAGWSVEKTVTEEVRAPVLGRDGGPVADPVTGAPLTIPVIDPATGAPQRQAVRVPVRPVSLLSADGLYQVVSGMVESFKGFPPLAIVLVGMLGIGLAERSGFLPVLLRASLARVPDAVLAPLVVFVGINSSLAVDAGYVVLPPIAAALFQAAGRPPLAGLAAAFAGVAGGFGANLAITGIDPLLAGLTESGARLVDPAYRVAATSNWWFAIAATFLLTATGWLVSARIVEPRLARASGSGPAATAQEAAAPLSPEERRGLRAGLGALALALAAAVAAAAIPGGPLHGTSPDGRFPRWVASIVPLLFLVLAAPGLAYGIAARTIRSDRDAARLLGDTMASLGPYVVLAFFAAQFVAAFSYSRLGELVAVAGGDLLAATALPTAVLIVAFVAGVGAVNLLMASMSAKYAFLAPVFVPMFMRVGVSPELVQAAYRVGDSVTNSIAPLNPYLVILVVLAQRYDPRAGLGTLLALMLPYAVASGLAWTAMLVAWVTLGLPLGPGAPLAFAPGAGAG